MAPRDTQRSARRERSTRDRSRAGTTRPPRRTRLRPPRDTGITLTPALSRDERLKRSRQAARMQAALVAFAVLGALLLGWQLTQPGSDAGADASPQATPAPAQTTVTVADRTDPTPLFGSYRSLHLYLPVPPEALTELAYHQASGKSALSVTSLLPDADMTAAEENKGTGRSTLAPSDDPSILGGEVLRMWRSNRTGQPDSAIDIGAAPGTPVYAPVTGEVIGVRPYRLYDKYDDFEIHIQPTGWPEVDVVMIHVENVSVAVGDQVIGGVTPIAGVRLLSDRVTHQLSAYTTDGGDHVHVQLNLLEVPGKLPPVGGGS